MCDVHASMVKNVVNLCIGSKTMFFLWNCGYLENCGSKDSLLYNSVLLQGFVMVEFFKLLLLKSLWMLTFAFLLFGELIYFSVLLLPHWTPFDCLSFHLPGLWMAHVTITHITCKMCRLVIDCIIQPGSPKTKSWCSISCFSVLYFGMHCQV